MLRASLRCDDSAVRRDAEDALVELLLEVATADVVALTDEGWDTPTAVETAGCRLRDRVDAELLARLNVVCPCAEDDVRR
jgi:hypothetical protein